MTKLVTAIFILFSGLNIYLAVYVLKIWRKSKTPKKVVPTPPKSEVYPMQAYEAQELKYEAQFSEFDIEHIKRDIEREHGPLPTASITSLVEAELRMRLLDKFCRELSVKDELFNIYINREPYGFAHMIYGRIKLFVLLKKC